VCVCVCVIVGHQAHHMHRMVAPRPLVFDILKNWGHLTT